MQTFFKTILHNIYWRRPTLIIKWSCENNHEFYWNRSSKKSYSYAGYPKTIVKITCNKQKFYQFQKKTIYSIKRFPKINFSTIKNYELFFKFFSSTFFSWHLCVFLFFCFNLKGFSCKLSEVKWFKNMPYDNILRELTIEIQWIFVMVVVLPNN